jgi:hypothetical protein
MTIKEIQEKIPGAQVLALTPQCKYLIIYKVSQLSHRDADILAKSLKEEGIFVWMVGTYDNNAAIIFEVMP